LTRPARNPKFADDFGETYIPRTSKSQPKENYYGRPITEVREQEGHAEAVQKQFGHAGEETGRSREERRRQKAVGNQGSFLRAAMKLVAALFFVLCVLAPWRDESLTQRRKGAKEKPSARGRVFAAR
jgi:hypothetical protein